MKLDLTSTPLLEFGHVQTRGGHPVRVVCKDVKGTEESKILGLCLVEDHDYEMTLSWYQDGRHAHDGESQLDLIPVVKKHTIWVNLSRVGDEPITIRGIYPSRSKADADDGAYRIACLGPLEFEEGRGLEMDVEIEGSPRPYLQYGLHASTKAK